MEKKIYIKPNATAYKVSPTEIICGSDFDYGGPGNPSGGRAKEILIDTEEEDIDSEW